MSRKVIIPQKMTGTGTIHDIESDKYEREIIFTGEDYYAIVHASYYGSGAEVFENQKECAKASQESEYSHEVIDRYGNVLQQCYGEHLSMVCSERFESIQI